MEIWAANTILAPLPGDAVAWSVDPLATGAWDTGGRWRLDGRYTYSRSSFETSGKKAGDNSILLRGLRYPWPLI